MAYRGVQLSFESEIASIDALVVMAQTMTTVTLVVKEGSAGRQSVAFPFDPSQWVDLMPHGERRVFISSVSAPALYQLMWMSAERLGATPPCPLAPLLLPLTEAGARRVARRESQRAALVLASIVGAGLAGVALMVWVVRWLSL